MTAHTGIPAPGLYVLGHRPFLQKQLILAVEDKDMGHPVNQGGIAMTLGARCLADDSILGIDDIKEFCFFSHTWALSQSAMFILFPFIPDASALTDPG
jgi:hypothetical protein